jgi:hypothetical protein
MCDALTNTCDANEAAKQLCAQAEAAANSATPAQTGAQADGSCLNWLIFMQLILLAVFNKFFGITTNFASVQPISNTGTPVGGASNPGSTPNNGTGTTSSDSSSANFGKCSTPKIEFADGLDGRKETAFEPADLSSRLIPVL